ncbi:hypothetical protein H8A95_09105 [Bradyrhizobium sp. Pear76]|uniref:hypothetical protein n=1 Tax=Bradyrhizobium oropedii TaxID=1571201 RepID=UPI001E339549|nr:hypothetical protein [Bradyrhizobium oropedii]MCC8962466.1 hypothetical protein [Bradyrhizobium oropedii]
MLDERYAPALRYMQDQPLVHVKDLAYAASFATRVAWAAYQAGITTRQLPAINDIVAMRRWVEPPRWLPWAEVVQDRGADTYLITVCPGTAAPEKLRQLAAAAPAGMPCGITIGPLYKTTRDIDDPRLAPTPSEKRRGKRTSYVTVCRRLVERASDFGLLIEI